MTTNDDKDLTTTQQPNPNPNPHHNRNFNEELEVAGSQLVERVKGIIEEGNVRRVIIRNAEGRILLEIPLTFGAVAGGALIWFTPMIAALAALGALVAKVRIEIVREESLEDAVEDAADKIKNDLEG